MSDRFDEDMMDDLMAHAPEGISAMDEFDEADAFDELEALDGADEFEEDGFEEFEEFEDAMDLADDEYDAGEGMDELEDAMAELLEADGADEFFGGFGKVLRSVGRGVGKVARTVAPIAKLIPLPQAQLVGRAADLIGGVLADEGDEMDALDEMADLAEEEDGYDALAPAMAALAIRGALKQHAARIPLPQRRQLVKTVAAATKHIARKHGARAVVAVPGIVRHARTIAARKHLSARHLPHLVARGAKVALRSPRATRKLAGVGAKLRTHPARHRAGVHGTGRTRYGGGAKHLARGASRLGASYGGARGSLASSGLRTGGGALGSTCPHCRRRSYHLTGPVRLTIEST
jgi:hypothetical protein